MTLPHSDKKLSFRPRKRDATVAHQFNALEIQPQTMHGGLAIVSVQTLILRTPAFLTAAQLADDALSLVVGKAQKLLRRML